MDDALKRRVDHFVKFDYSTKSQIEEMYNRFFPDDDNFEKFWEDTKYLKVTPNILQKLFVRHLDDPSGVLKEATAFITGEHSVDTGKDFYT